MIRRGNPKNRTDVKNLAACNKNDCTLLDNVPWNLFFLLYVDTDNFRRSLSIRQYFYVIADGSR